MARREELRRRRHSGEAQEVEGQQRQQVRGAAQRRQRPRRRPHPATARRAPFALFAVRHLRPFRSPRPGRLLGFDRRARLVQGARLVRVAFRLRFRPFGFLPLGLRLAAPGRRDLLLVVVQRELRTGRARHRSRFRRTRRRTEPRASSRSRRPRRRRVAADSPVTRIQTAAFRRRRQPVDVAAEHRRQVAAGSTQRAVEGPRRGDLRRRRVRQHGESSRDPSGVYRLERDVMPPRPGRGPQGQPVHEVAVTVDDGREGARRPREASSRLRGGATPTSDEAAQGRGRSGALVGLRV
ncbi:unnamed protein product [Pieris macdunnoughi]|uniref:Uncharacterized protein n=1 Tax=Pieris macdunnoughi TaxID=345717 RepID=A0A821LNH3_9NEOP|nr:unnamed protein product [Pieris macdunnoughi]